MAGSKIVEVRSGLATALATAINATAGMEAVNVAFQYPLGDNEPRECVWTQNGRTNYRPAALKAGRNFLREEARFDVVVRSTVPNVTPADAAQRALDIGLVVMEWIGDDKDGSSLAITGLQTLTVDGDGSQAEIPVGDVIAGAFVIPVKFTARIT